MSSFDLPTGISLDDPRPIAAEAPYTFFMPHPLELAALRPGDIVQAIFRQDEGETTYRAERMWVEVDRLIDGGVSGTLCNTPYDMPLIKLGDHVSLPLTHLITVKFSEKLPRPDLTGLPERRQYWDRCFVDDCVLRGRSHVDYLYREDPEPLIEGECDPDSGWRFRGTEAAVAEDEAEGRKAHYIAMGKVLNADDRWLPLIDRELGTAFKWDEAAQSYIELD